MKFMDWIVRNTDRISVYGEITRMLKERDKAYARSDLRLEMHNLKERVESLGVQNARFAKEIDRLNRENAALKAHTEPPERPT